MGKAVEFMDQHPPVFPEDVHKSGLEEDVKNHSIDQTCHNAENGIGFGLASMSKRGSASMVRIEEDAVGDETQEATQTSPMLASKVGINVEMEIEVDGLENGLERDALAMGGSMGETDLEANNV